MVAWPLGRRERRRLRRSMKYQGRNAPCPDGLKAMPPLMLYKFPTFALQTIWLE